MSIGTWSFNPIATSFPSGILPNTQFWQVTNGSWEYEVQLAYPLNWTSTNEATTVDTMQVLHNSHSLKLHFTPNHMARYQSDVNQVRS